METRVPLETEYAKQYVESQKLVFDYIKHITTLDTGSIILLTILLEKFLKTPQWRFLIISGFIGFIVSVIALTLSAFGIIRSVRTPLEIGRGLVRFTSWSFMIGIIGFIVGIGSIALLAAKNWP